MSMIPHGIFPRSAFDYDLWSRPLGPLTTLDLFDPFDALDHNLCRNLMWIDQPDFLRQVIGPIAPRVPQKYRITVDCNGFNPKSIKTELVEGKLVVSAKEGETKPDENGDYSVKEFKRTYKLPDNVEHDKMVSFVTGEGQLVIEFPVKQPENKSSALSHLPVVTEENGKKQVKMNFELPKHVDPAKVKVTCKDRDVIVQAEDKVEKPDGVSQFYFYQRSTLPENTDFDALKCTLDNNKLSIEAPCSAEPKPSQRTIQVENKQNNAIKN